MELAGVLFQIDWSLDWALGTSGMLTGFRNQIVSDEGATAQVDSNDGSGRARKASLQSHEGRDSEDGRLRDEIRELSRRIEDLAMQSRHIERELVGIRTRLGDRAFGAPADTATRSEQASTRAARLGKPGKEPHPEVDRIRRKYRKLVREPEQFFADASEPWVRQLGSVLLRLDSAARRVTASNVDR